MNWKLLVLVWLGCLGAAAALGRDTSIWPARSIQPGIPLVFNNPPTLNEEKTVGRNDTAWEETVVPPDWVSINSEVPARVRPKNTPGLEPGTELFVTYTRYGAIYCQPLDMTRVNPRSQCLFDRDNDRQFDGNYVADGRYQESKYVPGVLLLARDIDPVSYGRIERPENLDEPIKFIFRGYDDGQPKFRVFIGDERITDEIVCQPFEDSTDDYCGVLGTALQWERIDSRTLKFSIVGFAEDRGFELGLYGTTRSRREMTEHLDWMD